MLVYLVECKLRNKYVTSLWLRQSPTFCPFRHITAAQLSEVPPPTLARGVDVGCAVLLESADGRVLLVRRAAHLRTFPGIWVPPGTSDSSLPFPIRSMRYLPSPPPPGTRDSSLPSPTRYARFLCSSPGLFNRCAAAYRCAVRNRQETKIDAVF